MIQVDPKTVGQFTGFLDKNNVKVFEGDKIADPDNIYYNGVIYYSCGSFGINLMYDLIFVALSEFSKDELEIIGNCYI